MYLLYLRRKWVFFITIIVIMAFGANYIIKSDAVPAFGTDSSNKEMVLNLVTGEFKTKTDDGKEIEAYRWDPGTINVPVNEKVKLSIYGVNGSEHPFVIEGTDIKGTVKKGEEAVVNLHFEEEGIYRLICLTHPDIEHNGPMIAYIVVD